MKKPVIKKAAAALAMSAIMLTAMPLTVFAHGHGHHGGNVSSVPVYSLCSVENCNTTGNHHHDGITYTGHYIGDGHDYHQACTVEGCVESGCHDHDGAVCLPHNGNGCYDGSGSHHSTGHH